MRCILCNSRLSVVSEGLYCYGCRTLYTDKDIKIESHRNKRVTIRLTYQEELKIIELAKREGKSKSEYMRRKILN